MLEIGRASAKILPSRLAGRRPFHRRTSPGAPPGSLVSDPQSQPPHMHVIGYGPQDLVEQDLGSVDELQQFLGKHPVTWVNVDGLGDAKVIEQVGKLFGLHHLALEDVVHVHQRAKVEEYEDHLFIVTRMVMFDGELESEQLSIFLGNNFVLTFQEQCPGDCLDPVRERLRKGQERIRQAGADYLAYAIIDAVIDGYFPVIEQYGQRLDDLEEEISGKLDPESTSRIHQVRNDLLMLRRSIWPYREAVNVLLRDATSLISENTRIHLRDCYDHTIQIIDVLEMYRDICSDLRDLYFTQISTRTNEIMKVLTIIATIFIPLGFIAGVYGMNFDTHRSPWNMPELEWGYGYPFALGLMVSVAVGLLFYFWKKGWIGR